MAKGFEKAKERQVQKQKKKKKWWIVRVGATDFYIWALFLVPIVWACEKIEDWRYNRLHWTNKKADRILNKVLPEILEYDEDHDCYYYLDDWSVCRFSYHCSKFDRRWVDKYRWELKKYLIEEYEHPNYVKEVVYETWEGDGFEVDFYEKA